jgi:FkbM family methyltransferase
MHARPYCYLGNDRALTELSTGQPFFVNTRDVWITTWIVRGGTWETFVDDILCGVTRPGDTVLDVGANMGYYSVKLASIVGPSGSLVAFEPNPELFSILKDNIDINGLAPWSTVYQCALGDAEGVASLNFEYRNMGGGSISNAAASDHQQTHLVRVAKGDDVIDRTKVFDVMKFDIEGYEALAALGLADTIQRSTNSAMVVEVYPPAWKRFGDFSDVLDRFVQGERVGFEILQNGSLNPLNLRDSSCVEAIGEREDSMYLLLLPERHWAVNFAKSKCGFKYIASSKGYLKARLARILSKISFRL